MTRGDQADAAASSSIRRLAAARRRCRRNNIPTRTSSANARRSPLPAGRIDAAGRSGFTLPLEVAEAEQPQCSANSVFLALGPTGNGPRDSSSVHANERARADESPAARCRALDPASRPAVRRRRKRLRKTAYCSGGTGRVSPGYPGDAIGRRAGSALSSLIARGARAQPLGSGRAASAGSPTRASAPSPGR